MRLIKELYAVLPVVMLLNILSILFIFKKNSNTTHNEQEKSIFLWKDWLSLTIIGISALLLIGCVIFFSDNIFIAIMYNLMFFLFYARGITNAFLSSDCLWNIITGRSNGNCIRRRETTVEPFKSDTPTAEIRHSFRWSDSWGCKRGDRLICQPPRRLT